MMMVKIECGINALALRVPLVETDKGERMRPIKSFSTFCEDKMDSPTDAQGRILHKFTMSLDAYMNELIEMKEVCDTVEVTLTDDEPYKEVLRFHVAEE